MCAFSLFNLFSVSLEACNINYFLLHCFTLLFYFQFHSFLSDLHNFLPSASGFIVLFFFVVGTWIIELRLFHISNTRSWFFVMWLSYLYHQELEFGSSPWDSQLALWLCSVNKRQQKWCSVTFGTSPYEDYQHRFYPHGSQAPCKEAWVRPQKDERSCGKMSHNEEKLGATTGSQKQGPKMQTEHPRSSSSSQGEQRWVLPVENCWNFLPKE